jgi:alpha-L-fucosidase 2
MAAQVAQTDGEVSARDSLLDVTNASEAMILVSLATSFNGFDKNPATEGKDEVAIAEEYLAKAATCSYDELKKRHTADFSSYFNRVSIDLGPATGDSIPTPERLKRFTDGAEDNDLAALYFQYGRYLMISSSRPGGIPANLQGIWNQSVRPPWSSNFTSNINSQMKLLAG